MGFENMHCVFETGKCICVCLKRKDMTRGQSLVSSLGGDDSDKDKDGRCTRDNDNNSENNKFKKYVK
jgi:hypothetical protein